MLKRLIRLLTSCFKINHELVVPPPMDLPLLQLHKKNTHIEIPPFDLAEFNCTPKVAFKNHDSENRKKLGVLPLEIWIKIFSHMMPVNEILKMMLVCKFLGEVTNEQNFRMAFKKEKDQRFLRQIDGTTVSDPAFPMRLNTNHLFNVNHPYNIPRTDHNDPQGEEIYSEPGEKGFILIRR